MIKKYWDKLNEIDYLLEIPCFLIFLLSGFGGLLALANCQPLIAIVGFVIAAASIIPLESSRRLCLLLDEAEYHKRIYPDELLDIDNYVILPREDHRNLIKQANQTGSRQLYLHHERLDELARFMFYSLIVVATMLAGVIIYASVIGEKWIPALGLFIIAICIMSNIVVLATLINLEKNDQ